MESVASRVQDLAAAAEEFCVLVEHLDDPARDWLEQLSCLLPRIHAAVIRLRPETGSSNCRQFSPAEYDRHFELYSRLRRLLGDRDRYVLEFDTGGDGSGMSGSLADDITDIYFELRCGLELFDPHHPAAAAQVWRSGFLWHWGQHLVDAERHLYELEVSKRLFRGCAVD